MLSAFLLVSSVIRRPIVAKETFICRQVHEKTPLKVKNFGIWLRYDSRSGTHNMYREYRDLTTSGAVTQCCEWKQPENLPLLKPIFKLCWPSSSSGSCAVFMNGLTGVKIICEWDCGYVKRCHK